MWDIVRFVFQMFHTHVAQFQGIAQLFPLIQSESLHLDFKEPYSIFCLDVPYYTSHMDSLSVPFSNSIRETMPN